MRIRRTQNRYSFCTGIFHSPEKYSVHHNIIVWSVLAFLSFLPIAGMCQIQAGFSFTPDNQCSPMTVSFTNTSSGDNLSYHWNFGDGNESTEKHPEHHYVADPGNGTQSFTVILTVTGNGETNTQTSNVTVIRPPSTLLLDAEWPGFRKCTGDGDFELNLQNASFTDNVHYAIDWGDGSPLFETDDFEDISHNYGDQQGYWELVFTVEGANGCTHSEPYQVLYNRNPGLGVAGPEGTVGCAPLTLEYLISDIANNLGTKYTFTFNDGSPPYIFPIGTQPPASISHTFDEASCGTPGNVYTLTARAENLCGYQQFTIEPIAVEQEPVAVISAVDTICLGASITFHNNSLPPCGGNPHATTYLWTIDGEQTDAGTSMASQTYLYTTPGDHTVTLRASNTTVVQCNGGISETDFSFYIIDTIALDPPVVSGPDEGCAGEEYLFSATEDDHATYYRWTLSAGQLVGGQGTSEIRVFFSQGTESGDVDIRVRSENICSESDYSDIKTFTLLPLAGPVSSISGEDKLCEGQEIQLAYSIEPLMVEGDIYWQAPAGATILDGHGTTAITVLYDEGFTGGTLSVYAGNECGNTPASELQISLINLPVAANEIDGPAEVCQGSEVIYSVNPIQHASWYIWTFMGEEMPPVAGREQNFRFDHPGEAVISVRGVNDCGEGEDYTITVNVLPGPEPDFSPQDHCFGQTARFFKPGSGPDQDIQTWLWDFGDGYSSTQPNPVHVYHDIGSFTVRLEVTAEDGCTGVMEKDIEVFDIPVSRFIIEPERAFTGHELSFTDRSYMFHDTLSSADIFLYRFGDNSSSEAQNPLHTFSEAGTYRVWQIVDIDLPQLQFGCPDSSYQDISVLVDVHMPNAFNPGGGGGGGAGTGTFGPLSGSDEIFLSGDGLPTVFEFMVFNRWGERIHYEQSTNPEWDGRIRGGALAPQGVYVWQLNYRDARGKTIIKKGNVLLLK